MDRDLENFLLSTIASTFTSIGTTLSLILERRMGKSPQEERKNVEVIPAEIKAVEPAADKVETPETSSREAETQSASVKEEITKKDTAKPVESRHKTTIVEVRKIMTELSRKGKGKVIQDVLSKDFNVTKLSDVNEDDYDDFVTRVLYYAGETDAFEEVDNA